MRSMLARSLVSCGGLLLVALVGCLWMGCASKPKVDWSTRVGRYTYDQAVAELGPPDKTAKLSDNSTVAEWVTRKSSRTSIGFGFGGGSYGGGYGRSAGVGVSTPVGDSEKTLRLVFDADGKLRSAKEPAK